mmetsp:Transcript_20355/g.47576  ORF Transcript_20355/g.47576 Transcript_20355/m.47576 type:complete len:387 (+) Transcript_20355:14-1174(+)
MSWARFSSSPDADAAVAELAKAGVTAGAVTDTLSLQAVQACIEAGRKHGVRVFGGVEVPTLEGFTILGYFLDGRRWEYTVKSILAPEFAALEAALAEAKANDGAMPAAIAQALILEAHGLVVLTGAKGAQVSEFLAQLGPGTAAVELSLDDEEGRDIAEAYELLALDQADKSSCDALLALLDDLWVPLAWRDLFDHGWLEGEPFGALIPGTRLVPLKAPLHSRFADLAPLSKQHTCESFLRQQEKLGRKIGLVVDLTQDWGGYYDGKAELGPRNVEYCHFAMEGHKGAPPDSVVADFAKVVDSFLEKEPSGYVAVHCAHGLNRTGFMISQYLVKHKGLPPADALAAFATSRPPGLYRKGYIDELFERSGATPPAQAPEGPWWEKKD